MTDISKKTAAVLALLSLSANFCFAQRSLKDMNRGTFPKQKQPNLEEELQKNRRPVNIINAPGVRQTTINGNTVYIYDRPTSSNIPVYNQVTVSGGGYNPSFADQANPQFKNWAISAMGLDNTPYTGAGIVAAVLDSGVVQHEQFCEGAVDILNISGVDYDYDAYGHGTAIAGILGGCGPEGSGFSGVAPRVKMKVYKITDNQGNTNNINIGKAVQRILDYNRTHQGNPISVINISYGLDSDDEVVYKALKAAYDSGIVIVAPSGNDHAKKLAYPAAYDFVIAVGGLRPTRQIFERSNYGAGVAFVAPASAIYAPALGNSYGWVQGTSFAAPYISGMAVLIMEAYKKKYGSLPSPAKVREIMGKISEPQPNLLPQWQGLGLPNASKIDKVI